MNRFGQTEKMLVERAVSKVTDTQAELVREALQALSRANTI